MATDVVPLPLPVTLPVYVSVSVPVLDNQPHHSQLRLSSDWNERVYAAVSTSRRLSFFFVSRLVRTGLAGRVHT
jgi:hypothetical protein